jgi:hypothetical protein
MIEKEFIPYELALELEQLGFDEPCFAYLKPNALTYEITIGEFNEFEYHSAPTYSQAFRFFRDKHNINAQIAFCEYSVSSENSWKFTFDNPTNVLIWNGKFNTYEEAELECLKVLIEMVKTK